MSQIQHLVHQIPFFSDKNYSVYTDIYHNDAYPACLLVQDGIEIYKVRFPGVLNKNSVQNEVGALKLLSEHGVAGIPQIVSEGVVDGFPYLIEYYIEGSSLDKIHHMLSRGDWEHIAHMLALFLQELAAIQSTRPVVFKSPEANYNSYGEVIKESILRHLDRHTSLGIISPVAANGIQETLENIGSIFYGNTTFLHFDIKPQNIVFNPQSKSVAFIDYEHSRMGDYTHELFRADMAAIRNPYFSECWQLAKQEFWTEQSNHFSEKEYLRKLFYYELFYDISEMTYSIMTGNQAQVSAHIRGIENKLRQL